MVKQVDTKDLKSFGHCGHAGSIPAPGTKKLPDGGFFLFVNLAYIIALALVYRFLGIDHVQIHENSTFQTILGVIINIRTKDPPDVKSGFYEPAPESFLL